jgi:lysophospholipase L1-like esterase
MPAGASVRSAADTAEPTDGHDTVPRLIRLVTLGDGYTEGTRTAAPRRDSWPAQLAESLERSGMTVVLRNLAEQGNTSGDLLDDKLDQVPALQPDVVTVQVGVNDIIAHETDRYHENISRILDELLTILPAEHIFAITTPDHSLTEWGQRTGAADTEGAAVAEVNATLREVAEARDIAVIDIGQVNQLVASDPGLVVQLDPPEPYGTAKQYAGWAELIGLQVHRALAAYEP